VNNDDKIGEYELYLNCEKVTENTKANREYIENSEDGIVPFSNSYFFKDIEEL